MLLNVCNIFDLDLYILKIKDTTSDATDASLINRSFK